MYHTAILQSNTEYRGHDALALEDLLTVGQRRTLNLKVACATGHRHSAVFVGSSVHLSLAPGSGMAAQCYGGRSSGYAEKRPFPAGSAAGPLLLGERYPASFHTLYGDRSPWSRGLFGALYPQIQTLHGEIARASTVMGWPRMDSVSGLRHIGQVVTAGGHVWKSYLLLWGGRYRQPFPGCITL